MHTVYFIKSESVSLEREWDEGGVRGGGDEVPVIRSFVFRLKKGGI